MDEKVKKYLDLNGGRIKCFDWVTYFGNVVNKYDPNISVRMRKLIEDFRHPQTGEVWSALNNHAIIVQFYNGLDFWSTYTIIISPEDMSFYITDNPGARIIREQFYVKATGSLTYIVNFLLDAKNKIGCMDISERVNLCMRFFNSLSDSDNEPKTYNKPIYYDKKGEQDFFHLYCNDGK